MFAIAEFGSACRGTTDGASDRDILVVATRDQLARHRHQLAQDGFSVTALDPQQVAVMEKHGSLFLQHLKTEARFWIDDDGELAWRLDNAEAIPAPDEELERCKQSLQFVAALEVPRPLVSWRADVLYCLSRDLIIKLASRTCRPIYGIDSLNSGVRRELGIGSAGLVALQQLRLAKARHRRNRPQSALLDTMLDAWLKELENVLGLQLQTPGKFEPALLLDRIHVSNYDRVRALEASAILCRARGAQFPNADKTWALVTRLNEYREIRSTMNCTVEKQLERVVQALVDQGNRQP